MNRTACQALDSSGRFGPYLKGKRLEILGNFSFLCTVNILPPLPTLSCRLRSVFPPLGARTHPCLLATLFDLRCRPHCLWEYQRITADYNVSWPAGEVGTYFLRAWFVLFSHKCGGKHRSRRPAVKSLNSGAQTNILPPEVKGFCPRASGLLVAVGSFNCRTPQVQWLSSLLHVNHLHQCYLSWHVGKKQ